MSRETSKLENRVYPTPHELVIPSELEILDTHVHLGDPVFDPDRAAVLERAMAAGVSGIITVGEDITDAKRNLELSDSHPVLYPAAGLYPAFLDTQQAEELISLIREKRSRLIAIGEVGLDYWVVKPEKDKERQREIFTRFIELSIELDLPLNVHSRSAGRHAVELLLKHGARRVQMHAFDGKATAALPAVEAGYFFSIPPSVVRSRQKQKLVKQLPLACLLAETDSPVLGPDAGKRNEPANVIIALKTIAEIKGVKVDEVLATVSDNSRRLYGHFLAQ
jgi:TatD DNase family protein